MRVFVTGASGFVGSVVVAELLAHGHTVLGLARSDASAALIQSLGGEVLRGDLNDAAVLRSGATQCDAVIHCGFSHDDWSKYMENCAADEANIRVLGDALKGTTKPLVVTAGMFLPRAEGQAHATEDTAEPAHSPRKSWYVAQELKRDGIIASTVRLPPCVHGAGDKGFVTMLGGIARNTGRAAYVGEGANCWPTVHRVDAARLYRLALERGVAATYHGVGEEGVAFKDITLAIAAGVNVPAVSLAAGSPDVQQQFPGIFSLVTTADIPSSSAWTREALGWQPQELTLLDDIAANYFKTV